MKNEELNAEIRQTIADAQRVAIVSHIRPDGDAIGSLLGMGLALKAAGKEVQMVLADGVPMPFRFMPASKQIVRSIRGEVDLSIVLDCSDLQRTGGVLGNQIPTLNVDHHVTNLKFATFNVVEPEYVATASVLTDYLPRWGLEISRTVAEALLTGIITDSLGFRTSNTTSLSLRQAAELMEHGASLPELYHKALMRRSFEAARFWGTGLGLLEREGRLIWTSLSLEDRAAVSYPGNDDADLVNLLSTIEESDIAMIFVEQKDQRVKVSWRSQPGFDVSQIAVQFGGGGHPAASGAEIPGSLQEVQRNVLKVTHELWEQINNRKEKNGI